jgi:hypothetical protein
MNSFQFGRTNRLALPRIFSDILIHNGVEEIGEVEWAGKNIVNWAFTNEELVCVASDARVIIRDRWKTSGYQLIASAKRALLKLEGIIGQIEARNGKKITWPKLK